MLNILLISSLAGIAGTGLGGLVGLIFGRKSDKAVSLLLAAAAGVMMSIVFFDLVPEAMSVAGLAWVLFAILMGGVVVWVLNLAIDVISHTKQTHTDPKSLRHQKELLSDNAGTNKARMLKSGLLMFSAIALHNLPEGMAIGAGISHSAEMGVMLAVLIALHNIPEGISIAVPLMEGGMSRTKAVLLTALSGAPTLLGGLLGALMGSAGDILVGLSLGMAGGAMLYVTFCEMIPQALLLDKSRAPAYCTLAGVLFGLLIVKLL